MNPIDRIEAEQLRSDVPSFKPGDTVRVHVRVVEGDKERIQVFEGTVIKRSGGPAFRCSAAILIITELYWLSGSYRASITVPYGMGPKVSERMGKSSFLVSIVSVREDFAKLIGAIASI